MRILIVLTYYRPHYSGLTIYAERLATALAGRGHQVTVLTSQFSSQLPRQETVNRVKIVRVPVWMRISKGLLMPAFPFMAWRLIREAEVVNCHLPQLDAALVSLISRLLNKPVVLTYHCDLLLPPGFIHRLANIVSNIANHISASIADYIVTNTQDYADHSRFLQRYRHKLKIIPPPCEVPPCPDSKTQKFLDKYHIQKGQRFIGVVARLAAEKGIEHLVKALPLVLAQYPQTQVLYVGQYQGVVGEEAYARRLIPLIELLGSQWRFLGTLSDDELAAFFTICDVLVVPSTNSTESFGMVQIESMVLGTPVVASDIPGLRQAVFTTGMGKIFPPGDADALARAIMDVLENPIQFRKDPKYIQQRYSSDTIASEYEELYENFVKARS